MTTRKPRRSRTEAEPTIGAGLVRGLYDYARSQGAEAAILPLAQLSPDDLVDPDARIARSRYLALLIAAKEACRDPAFALHFGAAVDMQDMSIVGLIGLGAETVADAFADLNRYSRLIIETDGPAERYRLDNEGGALWLVDQRADTAGLPELTESSFARMAAGSARFGRGRFVLAAEVAHPAPSYADEYARVLCAPVRFSAGRNALRINPAPFQRTRGDGAALRIRRADGTRGRAPRRTRRASLAARRS